ncbi:hypothetical protein Daesc_006626 [Daldinia eschscholtzii]|uniref:Uncharacterized protein n=1 Tax=Daldinia eschscholtzii TaxID=292717 RepID=A0AAX6MHL1_9PEZI
MENFDWDAQLLSVDWTTVDWRSELHNFERVHWPEVLSSTLRRLIAMHREYDSNHQPSSSWPRTNPAEDEWNRRQAVGRANRGTEAQAVDDWFPDPAPEDQAMQTPSVPPGTVPSVPVPAPSNNSFFGPQPDSSPSTPARQTTFDPVTPSNIVDQQGEPKLPGLIYKDDPNGFWTVGFELELPVAVYRRGGLLAERPHPRDNRWEAEEILDDNIDPERVKSIVVNRFLEVFSAQTDMVFVQRDEDEDEILYELRMENMHRLEYGLPLLEDLGSHTSPNRTGKASSIDPLVAKAASDARDFLVQSYFNGSTPARNFLLASRSDIHDAVQRAIMQGVPSIQMRREADKHLEDLLNLEAYRRRRDKRHVPLAGMKPRYRAFSVYAIDSVNLDSVDDMHYRNVPEDIDNPSELYGWQTIKIVSPVMRLAWPPIELGNTLTEICRIVRNNFRVHKEMHAIQATTQVSISHTSGLNIMDIKKLASFLVTEAVHMDLRRYNRLYRAQGPYDHVCGPIRLVSQLGKLAQTNYNIDGFDSSPIIQRQGPQRTEQLNRIASSHLPIELLLQHENLAGRILHQAIWQYTDVDSISNALATGYIPRKTEVVVKCRGNSDMVNRPASDPEDELRRSDQADELNFYDVDKDRGVFEFRQMGLSLEPRHIMAWILVCWRMIEFVRVSQPPQYRSALEQIITNNVSVLEAIGLEQEVRQYLEGLISQPGQGLLADNRVIDWEDPFCPRFSQGL